MATVEEIIITSVPLWDPSVSDSLAKKDFAQVRLNLQKVFSNFQLGGWANIEWIFILDGAPAVRGNLTKQEWDSSGKPAFLRAVIDFANDQVMDVVFNSLSLEGAYVVRKEITKVLPGATIEEKLAWLKTNRFPLYRFFSVTKEFSLLMDGELPKFSPPTPPTPPPPIRLTPLPPPIPPRPIPPPASPTMIQTAEAAHPVRSNAPNEVKVKVNVGKSKVTWGSGN